MLKLPFGYRIYICWIILVLIAILPILWNNAKPLWRIICWLAPILLALDVDAGNRVWVYWAKFVVFILCNSFTLPILHLSNGFQNDHPYVSKTWAIPMAFILLIASCTLTVIGHHVRKTVWIGDYPTVKCPSNIFLVDKSVHENPYANYSARCIRTPLNPNELQRAWTRDKDGNKVELEMDEVHHRVLRTAFVTQFVMTRIFKSVQDKVYVYSLLAYYRVSMVLLVMAFAGVYHVLEGAFSATINRDIISSALLWLTLPSITLPALLRLKFGSNANLGYLRKGLLPVESDKEMATRLGITTEDLYCALSNAVDAGRVLKKPVGIIAGPGNSNVKILNMQAAHEASKNSLIGIENILVRVSDGKRFCIDGPHKPGKLMPLSAHLKLVERFDCPSYDLSSTDAIFSNGMNGKVASPTGKDQAEQVVNEDLSSSNLGGDQEMKKMMSMKDWGWKWETSGGILRPFLPRGCDLRKGKDRKRPKHEEDREKLLRNLAGEFHREEIETEEYDNLRKKIERQLSAAQVRKVVKKIGKGAMVSVAVVALLGLASMTASESIAVDVEEEEEEEEADEENVDEEEDVEDVDVDGDNFV